jgi:hypothetical protein
MIPTIMAKKIKKMAKRVRSVLVLMEQRMLVKKKFSTSFFFFGSVSCFALVKLSFFINRLRMIGQF